MDPVQTAAAYTQRGQQIFNTAYSTAAQVSQTGTPTMGMVFSLAIAIAQNVNSAAINAIVKTVSQAVTDAEVGASIGALIDMPEVGAAIGAILGALTSLVPSAGGVIWSSNTAAQDQFVDDLTNVTNPIEIVTNNDPATLQEAQTLQNFLVTRDQLGQSFGNTTTTQADVSAAWNSFVGSYPSNGATNAQAALDRYESIWTYSCPTVMYDVTIQTSCSFFAAQHPDGYAVQAAVLDWPAASFYSYLVGLHTFSVNDAHAIGLSPNDPAVAGVNGHLEMMIGRLADLIPAPPVDLSALFGAGIHVGAAPAAKPASAATSVATGTAVVAGVVLGGSALYAYLTHQAYKKMWGKIWDETGGKLLKKL